MCMLFDVDLVMLIYNRDIDISDMIFDVDIFAGSGCRSRTAETIVCFVPVNNFPTPTTNRIITSNIYFCGWRKVSINKLY